MKFENGFRILSDKNPDDKFFVIDEVELKLAKYTVLVQMDTLKGQKMLWVEYNINQIGDDFRVEGEWPGEVMGLKQDGSPKGYCLYKPGDIFIVTEDGWLVKKKESIDVA